MSWKTSSYVGDVVPFSEVNPVDDYLHPVVGDQPFTSIETNLYGFNIPEENIQCNIYILWHPVFKCMSMHIFVFKGDRILKHQLEADYFNEHLFLPAVDDISDYSVQLGSCQVQIKMLEPLNKIQLQFDDPRRQFALQLDYSAALPPVGRPGGKHFTQLMKTSGTLKLDGNSYTIDGHYMRDRSWGYQRPEQPEQTPPYRWLTSWFDSGEALVLAWVDTGMLDGDEFGPDWHLYNATNEGSGENKWESGGATPSLNFRSGWFAREGKILPVVRMEVRTQFADSSRLLVTAIELDIEDAEGGVHQISGTTRSMIPKAYWQNLLTYMHAMDLRLNGQPGHGDLMDTYSTHHIKKFGL